MAVRKVDAWSLDCISYASLVALLDRPAYVERIEYRSQNDQELLQ